MEAIGLRNIAVDLKKRPTKLVFRVPNFDALKWETFTRSDRQSNHPDVQWIEKVMVCKPTQSGSAQIMDEEVFKRVLLPAKDSKAILMLVEVKSDDNSVLGSAHVSLHEYMDLSNRQEAEPDPYPNHTQHKKVHFDDIGDAEDGFNDNDGSEYDPDGDEDAYQSDLDNEGEGEEKYDKFLLDLDDLNTRVQEVDDEVIKKWVKNKEDNRARLRGTERRENNPQTCDFKNIKLRGERGDVTMTLKVFLQMALIQSAAKPRTTERQRQHLVNDLEASRRLNANIRRIYRNQLYTTRLYIYKGVNLAPKNKRTIRSPAIFFSGVDDDSANPYLVIKNGATRDRERNYRQQALTNTLNPDFYKVVEMPTIVQNELTINVWDKNSFLQSYLNNDVQQRNEGLTSSDSLIGSATIDLEDRLLKRQHIGTKEYLPLRSPDSSIDRGILWLRVDILEEKQARKQKAEEIRSAVPIDYQLRMIIWKTKGIRYLDESDLDAEVDQRIRVTANFEGELGADVHKHTEVAWSSRSSSSENELPKGSAEWNHRMIWNLTLPCKVPRIKIAMWHENIVREDEAIGEVLYNLQSFFDKGRRLKKPVYRQKRQWLNITHPNHPGVLLGEVSVEFALYTRIEAQTNPAGEARDHPNRDP